MELESEKKYRVVNYDFILSTAGSTNKQEIVLESDITKIVGLKLNAEIDAQAYNRGTIGIDIDKVELFSASFQAKNIMAGLDCPPLDRFWEVQKEVKNRQLKVEYTDISHPSVTFATNKVTLVLLCETSA